MKGRMVCSKNECRGGIRSAYTEQGPNEAHRFDDTLPWCGIDDQCGRKLRAPAYPSDTTDLADRVPSAKVLYANHFQPLASPEKQLTPEDRVDDTDRSGTTNFSSSIVLKMTGARFI